MFFITYNKFTRDIGMVVGFCIIVSLLTCLIIGGLIPLIKYEIKNIKMDNQIVEMMTVKTSI